MGSIVSRNRLRVRPRPAVEHRPPPYRRRRLEPGDPAAPKDGSVPLLPLGPDGVRRSSSHEAQPSTPMNGGRHDGGNPQAGIQPAVADCGSRAPLAPHLARPLVDSRRSAREGQCAEQRGDESRGSVIPTALAPSEWELRMAVENARPLRRPSQFAPPTLGEIHVACRERRNVYTARHGSQTAPGAATPGAACQRRWGRSDGGRCKSGGGIRCDAD